MKKPAVFLFALYYLLTVAGFSIDMHWCGKNVKLISINSNHESKCPCGKKMPSGCCKDVHVSVKLTESQQSASALTVPKNNIVKHIFEGLLIESPVLYSPEKVFCFTDNHAPPFKNKQPVYLANCIFLI